MALSTKPEPTLTSPATPSSRPVAATPRVSMVVPVADRADDLVDIYTAHATELRRIDPAYEVVFVFDGSFGPPPPTLLDRAAHDPHLRVLALAHSFGETGALRVGLAESHGEAILTMPPYLQVHPRILSQLWDALVAGADLVVTRRSPRCDGWFNQLQSRIFNSLVRLLTGTSFSDIACGARAMRRDVAESLTLYGDLHRFIPAIAERQGFRVVEIPCAQHAADRRTRIYSVGTYLRRALDLVTLLVLLKFTEKPLRFFGFVGFAFGTIGGVICGVLAIQRLAGIGIANRPLLLLGVLLIALGVQIMAIGLVGEIVVHWQAGDRPLYRIRRVT